MSSVFSPKEEEATDEVIAITHSINCYKHKDPVFKLHVVSLLYYLNTPHSNVQLKPIKRYSNFFGLLSVT